MKKGVITCTPTTGYQVETPPPDPAGDEGDGAGPQDHFGLPTDGG
ncbi:MAG: hypothetical protein WBW48_06310 [Anaerolineae bacterium]